MKLGSISKRAIRTEGRVNGRLLSKYNVENFIGSASSNRKKGFDTILNSIFLALVNPSQI